MKPGLAVLLLPLLTACGGPASPWPAEPATTLDLRIAVAPTTVQLLEPVTVTLDLWRREGIAVDWQPAVDGKDFASTLTVSPERPLFGGHWQRTVLVLKPLRGPGELVLPPFAATEREGAAAATTPEQTITVATALAGADAAIEAPGDPFPARLSRWWWAAVAAVPLLLALVWWFRRRPRTVQRDPAEVQLPPHTKAQRALQRLRSQERTTKAQIDTWYVDVSSVLRVYLEERFGLRAPERTTEEFLRELESGDQLARDHRRELDRFLSHCDLVKFAGLVPSPNDHEGTLALASAFVEATRPDRIAGAAATMAAPPAEVAS
jgi:hypothetical protein